MHVLSVINMKQHSLLSTDFSKVAWLHKNGDYLGTNFIIFYSRNILYSCPGEAEGEICLVMFTLFWYLSDLVLC